MKRGLMSEMPPGGRGWWEGEVWGLGRRRSEMVWSRLPF